MLINLTKSVPLKELCKVSAIGDMKNTDQCVEFTLSHEAIIGFATELLWMYEDINDSKKLVISTNQLQVDPSPNQVLGFYLTPSSPMLVLKVNSLVEKSQEKYECRNWKEIAIRSKSTNQYYNVRDPLDEEVLTLESYELSRKNIMDIKVFDDKGVDITRQFSTIILELNRKGIKEFATMLLVWANNCREGDEYRLPNIGKLEYGYNLGVVLTHNSMLAKFKCHDLGTTYDYDIRL